MKQLFKNSGFTLIELLVVIVIVGILSTISVSSFRSHFARTRDAERYSALMNLALIIRMDSGAEPSCGKYNYINPSLGGGDCTKYGSFEDMLFENEFTLPEVKNEKKYYYGFLLGEEREGANDFFVMVLAEEANAENATLMEALGEGSDRDYAFLDGTQKGIEDAKTDCVYYKTTIRCNANSDWKVLEITDTGALKVQTTPTPPTPPRPPRVPVGPGTLRR